MSDHPRVGRIQFGPNDGKPTSVAARLKAELHPMAADPDAEKYPVAGQFCFNCRAWLYRYGAYGECLHPDNAIINETPGSSRSRETLEAQTCRLWEVKP